MPLPLFCGVGVGGLNALLTRAGAASACPPGLPSCSCPSPLTRFANLSPASFFGPFFIFSPSRNQLVAVSNGMPLFEVYLFHWMMSRLRDALKALPAYSSVDKSAMLIASEVISDDGPSIKFMHPLPSDVEDIFALMSSQPMRERLMEMIVTNEHEKVFAQAEIEANVNDCTAVKSPTAIDPYCAVGQRRPTNISVRFRLAPTNPGWAPSIIRHPEPAVTGISNPAAIVKRNVSPVYNLTAKTNHCQFEPTVPNHNKGASLDCCDNALSGYQHLP